MFDWSSHAALEERWRSLTGQYVGDLNAYVKRGEEEGWDNAGNEPTDQRDEALGRQVIEVVRAANEAGAWKELRERYPTAHAPLIPLLEEKAIGISNAFFLDDDRVVAHVGGFEVRLFHVDGSSEVLDTQAAGVSWDRAHVAMLKEDAVVVTEGLGGAEVSRFDLPKGNEGLPEAYTALDPEELGLGRVERLRPFRKGKAVLVVAESGVWVLSGRDPKRIFPDEAFFADQAEDWEEGEAYLPNLSMLHGEVSPDGKLIAAGSQDSQHVVAKRSGEVVARFGPIWSEYPHHAGFSPDNKWAFFNSCHFYNGESVKVRRRHLEGLFADGYEEHDHAESLSSGPRVYCSAWHEGAFLLGTSPGYVIAVDAETSALRFRHFVGSTVNGVDVSPSGQRMVVSTYAGFLSFVDLAAETPDPFVIGTGSHREMIRFVRWRDEPLWRW